MATLLTLDRGYTPDLVLLYGLPVLNLDIEDLVFLDHEPVWFVYSLG